MKRFLKIGLVLGMVLVFGAGSVLAADTKRDRKRDGSCKDLTIIEQTTMDLAATQKRDRKRDRSCQSLNAAEDDSMDLAAAQKRQRKRDGSCRTS